jgi:hypothetical protein
MGFDLHSQLAKATLDREEEGTLKYYLGYHHKSHATLASAVVLSHCTYDFTKAGSWPLCESWLQSEDPFTSFLLTLQTHFGSAAGREPHELQNYFELQRNRPRKPADQALVSPHSVEPSTPWSEEIGSLPLLWTLRLFSAGLCDECDYTMRCSESRFVARLLGSLSFLFSHLKAQIQQPGTDTVLARPKVEYLMSYRSGGHANVSTGERCEYISIPYHEGHIRIRFEWKWSACYS